jgi:hypothetical protein
MIQMLYIDPCYDSNVCMHKLKLMLKMNPKYLVISPVPAIFVHVHFQLIK